jgi:cysteine desulfurase family protein (TIGR01976 family)
MGDPLDVARVRGLFPGLADGYAHLESAAGTLMPESVASAISTAVRLPVSARGGVFPASGRAEALTAAARSAVADLVGAVPDGVVLGPSMTTLTWHVARALARTWRPGDEVVVSRLDHDANVRPWVQLAEEAGVTVRWAEVDIETGELPAWQYDELITDRTRLVALTAASHVLGTRPDVAAIAARAHAAGALTYVDAVHAAPHTVVDAAELGADFLAVSGYTICGPHVSAVVASPELLGRLEPDRLLPAPDRVPERFEEGTPPFELYAGLSAAVDHLAGLCGRSHGPRRDRLRASMAAVAAYEGRLFARLDGALRAMPHVQLLPAPAGRTPTLSFTVPRSRPRHVVAQLARRGVCAWDGDGYARELFDALGVTEAGGAVRLGIVHYNTLEEVDRAVDAIGALARPA